MFKIQVQKLDLQLGPGTSDLKIRWGLHSGPVTAGVLRGERGRFQLFGDTVNTAARLESTGAPNRIHLSQELVYLLIDAGKSHWVSIREGTVVAKGKGVLNTYWLEATAPDLTDNDLSSNACTDTTSSSGSGSALAPGLDRPTPDEFVDQNQGLVDWNLNILKGALTEVVAKRRASGVQATPPELMQQLEKEFLVDRTSLEEVKEIVCLPKYDAATAGQKVNNVELSDTVLAQLRSYIYQICSMYNNNPFHNFGHATHVTMSVVKLMSRIVAPERLQNNGDQSNSDRHLDLHDHTYGITSDPMTQFAVLLSALVSFPE